MKLLSKYLKDYRKEVILAPFFKFLEACFELVIPLIIATLVDKVIPQGRQDLLFGQISLLFGLAIAGVVMALAAQFYSAKAAVGISSQIGQDLFQKILSLPQGERDKIGSSSLINRVTTDTLQLQTGINLFLRLFLRAPIVVFGSLLMAIRISPQLSLSFLGMIVLLFVVVFGLSFLLRPLYQEIRGLLDRLVAKTREQMQGMRVIRAFNQSSFEIEGFKGLNHALFATQVKSGQLSGLLSPLTFLVVNSTLILLLWQGHALVQSSVLSQGAIVALVNYLLQILVELLKLAILLQSLNQAYISSKRIDRIFALRSEDKLSAIERETDTSHSMVVENLSFTYPNGAAPALSELSFALHQGQHLGIIGGTGAGKTTLIKLVSGLYSDFDGDLSIFRENQTPHHLMEWREWVAVVPQKAELFQGSLRENLCLGLNTEPSDDDIWKALDIAQASDFVRERDGQLDSLVTAFGRSLSGGQRQRLTIARAVLQKKPFLILDDATSALDYLTESKLLKALKENLVDTTLIFVSQRTRVLTSMDKILVLEKGNQVGFDSHEGLLATNTIYQDIFASQHQLEGGGQYD